MERRFLLIGIGLFLGWALFMAIKFGLQDKIDPTWEGIDHYLTEDYHTLDLAIPDLNKLYKKIHKQDSLPSDSFAFNIVATPFLPTIEFKKFNYYVEQIESNNFVLISGVSGVGTTTLTNRLARFIASGSDNIMEIFCAPLFDLELHKQYIGIREGNRFSEGELLQFFDRCFQYPEEKFVLLIDDLDRINPESFFGPLLWKKLDEPDFKLEYNGKAIKIPDNFYLICVTHAGAGSRVELNNEHFRRLGIRNYVDPAPSELVLYLRNQLQEKKEALLFTNNAQEKASISTDIKALEDTVNLKKFLYSFIKVNEYIEQNYSKNHRLGQWSNLRRYYKIEDRELLFRGFLEHVNALKPDKIFRNEDLIPIRYALETNGRLKGSNLFSQQFKALEEKGFLTEFLVGLTFLLISGLFSWYFFRRRQRYIKTYTDQIHQLFEQFENNQLNFEQVSQSFSQIKSEVDQLIIAKKINYSEASFFYNFIENKVRQIEVSKEVNRNFRELVNTFMEDDILTENEYRKLKSFLRRIKNKINLEDYTKFMEEIEALYKTYGVK